MRKAGGIVTLIAGIFGLVAAVLYLMFGVFLDHQALIQRAFYSGAFAFLMIGFASLSLTLPSRLPAILMMVTAIIAFFIFPSDVLNYACMLFGSFLAGCWLSPAVGRHQPGRASEPAHVTPNVPRLDKVIGIEHEHHANQLLCPHACIGR